MSASRRPTVLIVDDDPTMRQLVVEVLSLEGFPTETAAGGREALDLLPQLGPRVILLDLLMPEVNGWDVVRQLEADAAVRTRHQIILLSAWANLEKASDLKVEGRLAKPFNVDQLLNVVEPAAERLR